MARRGKQFKRLLWATGLVLLALLVWYVTAPASKRRQVDSAARDAADKARDIVAGVRPQFTPSATERSHAYAGLPRANGYPHAILVLTNQGYITGYDEERKNPAWVCYRLFKVPRRQIASRPSRFLTDERTSTKVRHDDYTRSGYDRGHMAPNSGIGQCYGDEAQRETFLMTNIVPQHPKLNREFWRLLEERMETDYAMRFEEVWVTSGPLYDRTRQNLAAGVEVPDAFFQITVDVESGQPRALAFVVPQSVEGGEAPSEFLTSIDAVEKLSGLDFLSALEDALEGSLEADRPVRLW